jgi:hypothetical protein
VICLGYKGYVIKEYFANYFLLLLVIRVLSSSFNPAAAGFGQLLAEDAV